VAGLLGIPAPAHARPLADLPVDELAERGDELAKGWAAALLLGRPLQRIGELALPDLALDGPTLCVQALRALESDDALSELLGEEPRAARVARCPASLAAIAGGQDTEGVIAAVEALRAVLWRALTEELRDPGERRLIDAADRLAYVCAVLTDASLHALAGEREQAEHTRSLADALADRVAAGASRARGAPREPPVVIVDEHIERSAYAGAGAADAAPAMQAARAEIAVRDQRGEGPAAWIDSIGRALTGHREDRRPFSVLLVQMGERERERRGPLAAVGPDAAAATVEAVLEGVHGEPPAFAAAPSGDPLVPIARATMTRERPGRYWLIVPGLDRPGAQVLADRLTSDVAALAARSAQHVQVAIGTASCPQDASDASALAAHADVGVYAARAAARAAAARPSAGGGAAGERGGL
jgi:hypothetical protein